MKKRRSRRRLRKKRHRGRRSRRRSRRRRLRRRRSRKRKRGAGFNNTKTDKRSNVKKPNNCAEEKRIIRELRERLRGPSGGTPKSPPPRQNPFHDEYIGSPATPIRPHAARRLF